MHFSNSIRKQCWLPALMKLMRCDGYCANARLGGASHSLMVSMKRKPTTMYLLIDQLECEFWACWYLYIFCPVTEKACHLQMLNIAFYKQRSHDIVTVKVEFSPGQFQECSTIFVHKCQANVLRVECAKVCKSVQFCLFTPHSTCVFAKLIRVTRGIAH